MPGKRECKWKFDPYLASYSARHADELPSITVAFENGFSIPKPIDDEQNPPQASQLPPPLKTWNDVLKHPPVITGKSSDLE